MLYWLKSRFVAVEFQTLIFPSGISVIKANSWIFRKFIAIELKSHSVKLTIAFCFLLAAARVVKGSGSFHRRRLAISCPLSLPFSPTEFSTFAWSRPFWLARQPGGHPAHISLGHPVYKITCETFILMALWNGVFPAILVNRMPQPSGITAFQV